MMEDAIYAVVNLFQETSKETKEGFLFSQELFSPFVALLCDFHSVEHELLRRKGVKFLLKDYQVY